MTRSKRQTLPSLPSSFVTKKNRILAEIAVPTDSYTDKSPKGSIDAPIRRLIDELNSIEGIVTTSSCSGRVAVFVEGPKSERVVTHGIDNGAWSSGGLEEEENGEHEGDNADGYGNDNGHNENKNQDAALMTGGPAGKGGGHWLFVSHDPVQIPDPVVPGFFTEICGLSSSVEDILDADHRENPQRTTTPRLIKLSFSPLILHILCATPQHAKPLLAAAINAGFRESGVQSLKALDEPEHGVMVGIRTMGLGFETVIGVVHEPVGQCTELVDDRDRQQWPNSASYRSSVHENYLALMFKVINERFQWNLRRKERLVNELRSHFRPLQVEKGDVWEDRDTRSRRKREEGLRRQKEKKKLEEEQTVDAYGQKNNKNAAGGAAPDRARAESKNEKEIAGEDLFGSGVLNTLQFDSG